MTTVDKKIQVFCQKYEAQVEESSLHYQRYKTSIDNENLIGPINDSDLQIEEPIMVRIDMPMDKFRTLVHMEDKLKQWAFDERLRGSRFGDFVNYIYEKEYREVSIRERYPVVQRAYDQYLIILAFAEVEGSK